MEKKILKKADTIALGIISGIIVPVLVYFLLYFAKIQSVHTTLFSNNLLIGNIIPIIISHCILPNLVLFFIFNALNWMQSAKGILGTTVVLTIIIFAIKLLFTYL